MNKICFRKDTTGEIYAVFLDEINHHSKLELMCYAHMGQHGGCCIRWLYSETIPAKESEYKSLLAELTNIVGYKNLELKKRLPKYDQTIRTIIKLQRECNR